MVFTASTWWSYVARIGGFYIILAWFVHRLAWRMTGLLVCLIRFSLALTGRGLSVRPLCKV